MSKPCGRVNSQTALWPFGGWPACRPSSKRPYNRFWVARLEANPRFLGWPACSAGFTSVLHSLISPNHQQAATPGGGRCCRRPGRGGARCSWRRRRWGWRWWRGSGRRVAALFPLLIAGGEPIGGLLKKLSTSRTQVRLTLPLSDIILQGGL
jgi:hypothetical protein